MSVEQKCPLSVPIPISLTVNTSGSVPSPVNNSHSLSATHSGFTRISEFTFSSNLTGAASSINELRDPPISTTLAIWDFGDGHTLSAKNTPTTTHTYNVPGIYTVAVYYYDLDGNAYFNTLTETVSVYNYIETTIEASNTNVDSISGELAVAGSVIDLPLKIYTSWQDTIDTNEYTLYVAASGSKSKIYDTKNKYAHLLPFNAFYNYSNDKEELITSEGAKVKTNQISYAIDPSDNTIKLIPEDNLEDFNSVGIKTYMLGSTTERLTGVNTYTVTGTVTSFTGLKYTPASNIMLGYVDDTPNTDPGVQLLVKLDTSKHRVKNFYVDDILSDINASGQPWLETGGIALKNYSGMFVKIIKPAPDFNDLFSFTSTGMKEMSAINYKRQGDKFQVFIGIQDKNKNILKHYPIFLRDNTGSIGNVTGTDNTFYVNWTSDGASHTSNISSVSTNKFPYNTTTGNTELSSFLYLNIDPLSAGTWTLNVSAHIESLDAGTIGFSGFGNTGGCVGTGNQHYTGS